MSRLAIALAALALPACDSSAGRASALEEVGRDPVPCAIATEGERQAYIAGWAAGTVVDGMAIRFGNEGCAAVAEYRRLMGGAR
jgi:hypothetical protein